MGVFGRWGRVFDDGVSLLQRGLEERKRKSLFVILGRLPA
jgi:hypothetical protein